MRKALCVLLLLLALPSALRAQDDEEKKKPKPKPDCTDGVVYDDGKLESGLRPNSLAARGDFVMLFEANSYPAKLNKVCIAWTRTSFWTTVYFDLRIWAADGEDGKPGKLLWTVPVLSAAKVPSKAKFYSYDVAWADIVIDGPVYIGPSYDPLDAYLIYIAMDKGPRTQLRRGFYGAVLFDSDVKPPSSELGSSIDIAPGYRALGIRAVFGSP
jgi:hypothetical protein